MVPWQAACCGGRRPAGAVSLRSPASVYVGGYIGQTAGFPGLPYHVYVPPCHGWLPPGCVGGHLIRASPCAG